MLPVIDLAPRGEDGMVASVEETESSASSTSSGRHSAGLPIVGPPRGLLATGLAGVKILFRFFIFDHNQNPIVIRPTDIVVSFDVRINIYMFNLNL